MNKPTNITKLAIYALAALLSTVSCSSKEESAEPEKTVGSLKEGSESETAKAPVDADSLVGFFTLPVSLRSGDSAPSNCHLVEMTPTQLRINKTKSLNLSGGQVADAEQSNDEILPLKSAMTAEKRTCLALHVHTNVSYRTVVQILNTASNLGVKTASFKVRKPMGSTETGWLALNDIKVLQPSEEEIDMNAVPPRPWSEFTEVWDTVYSGCAGAQGAYCVEKSVKIAEGGNLQIGLFAAGDAVTMEFKRVGAEDPNLKKEQEEAEKAKAKKKGKKKVKSEPEEDNPIFANMTPEMIEEYKSLPFATKAGFQLRGKEAIVTPSPVSATMAPVCGKKRCGVVMTGRKRTIAMRFLSLIGSAFPDGTPAPVIWFVLPNE